MKLLTSDDIQKTLKAMWDSVLKIPDQQLKEFAAKRVSAKEKEMVGKQRAQLSLMKELDLDVAEELSVICEFLNDQDIFDKLLAKYEGDIETLNAILTTLKLITNLIKQSV